MTDIQIIIDQLESAAKYQKDPLYGIFYKGKLLRITKVRIYKQPSRGKSELVTWIKSYIPWSKDSELRRGEAKQIVDQLILDGLIEIKELK